MNSPILIALLAVSIILLIIFILLIKFNHRNRHPNSQPEDIIKATLDSQEYERNLLGSELDSLGAMLSSTKISLQIANKKSTIEDFSSINNQLDEAIGKVRIISNQMIPTVLRKYGLERALVEMITQINASRKAEISYQIDKCPHLSNERELILYRIIQELLNNSIQHSKAQKIQIQLKQINNSNYRLSFHDDGVGFTHNLMSSRSYIELGSIKNRAQAMKSELMFSTRKKGGSKIILEIPESIN